MTLSGQCAEADVLIVDPPRKGLDDGVLRLLLGEHETAEAPGACIVLKCSVSCISAQNVPILFHIFSASH